MIELYGSYTTDDIRRASLRSMWRFVAWVYALSFLYIVYVVVSVISAPGANFEYWVELGMYYFRGLLYFTAFVVACYYFAASRRFHKTPVLREPITYVFTSEAISITRTSISSRVLWSALIKVRETKNLFFLYIQPGGAVIVPKRFFQSAEEMERWRQLVSSCIDPKLIQPPTFLGRWG